MDAGGDTADADADADAGGEATGADDDSATTPEESVALRPWTDPLPHPTRTTPTTTATEAARCAALMLRLRPVIVWICCPPGAVNPHDFDSADGVLVP